ncbi:hypothetical protein [Aquitalea pelogenes]|uniref:hypothetical protein n=1 Tax=Aquitalea pelogenes TaxID=1293573 RepID=UPI0035B06BEF
MRINTPYEKMKAELEEDTFKKYIRYFNKKTRLLKIKATLEKIEVFNDDDLRVIDEVFPLYSVRVFDEGDVIFNFVFDTHSVDEFSRFNKCFKSEVFYYVKSKFLAMKPRRFEKIRNANRNNMGRFMRKKIKSH